MGGFEDDKRHGLGYLLDYATEHKTREEWVRGAKTAGSVTQPSNKADLDEHLGAASGAGGLYYSYQGSPMRKALLGKARASFQATTAVQRFSRPRGAGRGASGY